MLQSTPPIYPYPPPAAACRTVTLGVGLICSVFSASLLISSPPLPSPYPRFALLAFFIPWLSPPRLRCPRLTLRLTLPPAFFIPWLSPRFLRLLFGPRACFVWLRWFASNLHLASSLSATNA